MGGVPDPGSLELFNVLVLCAKEVQPKVQGFKGTIIRAPFGDVPSLTSKERRTAIRAAREVAKRLRKGQKVLVTCHMGWNRSGLVTALALRMSTHRGTDEIIRRIRKARGPNALSNESFVRMIYGFGMHKKKAPH